MMDASVWNTPDYFAVDYDINKERHLIESLIPDNKVIYSPQSFKGVAAKLLFPLIIELLPKPLLSEDVCNQVMTYTFHLDKKDPLVQSIVNFKVKKNSRIFEQLIRLEDYLRDYPQSQSILGEEFCYKLAKFLCGDKYADLSEFHTKLSFLNSFQFIKDQIRSSSTDLGKNFKNNWTGEEVLQGSLEAMWKRKCPYLQF